MNLRLTLRPEAEDDVEAALAWYSSERRALALAFVDSLDRLLLRIRDKPHQFPQVAPGMRRALMERFPYGVFFSAGEDRVVVLAVLHLHRHPDTWRARKSPS